MYKNGNHLTLESVIDQHPGATRAPVISHGLNKFDAFNNIYFSAALNREPKHFAMLNALGLDSDRVQVATAQETLYQCIMRTSLRNPEATDKVHAIVPDQPAAERLASLLGARSIEQLGDLYRAPLPPLTQRQRSQRSKAKKLTKRLFDREKQQSSFIYQESSILRSTSETPNDQEESNSPTYSVTFHKNIWANDSSSHIIQEFSLPELVAMFRTMAANNLDHKDDAFLFNPTVFNPRQDGAGYRKVEHFQQSSFLALDFDDGMLSPEEFERIFWHEAGPGQKRSFIICNSFSRSPERPNKFRVIMLYRNPATSIAQHKAVYAAILDRLERNGFSADQPKLDPQCATGVQSFYAPCTNRAYPDLAFFRAYGTRAREVQRHGIDPVIFERTALVPFQRPIRSSMPTISPATPEKIAAITAELRSKTQDRNHLTFMTGLHLARGGLLPHEVEAELRSAVGPQRHMQKKIAGVIKSLKGYAKL